MYGMPFHVNQELVIDGVSYRFASTPKDPDMVLCLPGRYGRVYQLINSSKRWALKVFKRTYQESPELASLSERVRQFADLPGLQVCHLRVLTPSKYRTLTEKWPDLVNAVLMPWITGPNWSGIMLSKQALTSKQCLAIARAMAQIGKHMESHGVAHCDISGSNVLLPMLALPTEDHQSSAALVDIEQIYGPGLMRPKHVPGGTDGYAHRTIREAPQEDRPWNADVDRFAAAILLAEMLGWCDDRIRGNAREVFDTYFVQDSLQQDTGSYQTMRSVLNQSYGRNVGRLFEQAWWSATLSDCPAFAEWVATLPELEEFDSVSSDKRVTPSSKRKAASSPESTIKQFMDLGQRLRKAGDVEGALVSYGNARQLTSPDDPVRMALDQIIEELQTVGISPKKETPKPTKEDELRSQTPPSASTDDESREWIPETRNTIGRGEHTITNEIWRFFWVFVGVGALLFIILSAASGTMSALGASLVGIAGPIGQQSVSLGGLALVIGSLQAWIFRKKISTVGHRYLFVLATGIGGLAGGAVSGLLISVIGGIGVIGLNAAAAGAVAGIVAGLTQSLLMHSKEARINWVVFNTLSWCIVWGIGEIVSFYGGTALGAGFILVAAGATQSGFLRVSPEVEF